MLVILSAAKNLLCACGYKQPELRSIISPRIPCAKPRKRDRARDSHAYCDVLIVNVSNAFSGPFTGVPGAGTAM